MFYHIEFGIQNFLEAMTELDPTCQSQTATSLLHRGNSFARHMDLHMSAE